MTAPSFRERYFEALGFDPAFDLVKLKAAHARAYEMRKFEIELYWKRAAYFWAFQLVAFTALGLLFKDGELKYTELLLVPATIGTITACAGFLTSRGSKFWQENWEAHVDMLEGAMKGRLTQVVVCRGPQQFSVSRTNQFLLFLLMVGWVLVLIAGAFPQTIEIIATVRPIWRGAVVLVLGVMACGLMVWNCRTELSGQLFLVGEANWVKHRSKGKSSTASLIWRDSPGEDECDD